MYPVLSPVCKFVAIKLELVGNLTSLLNAINMRMALHHPNFLLFFTAFGFWITRAPRILGYFVCLNEEKNIAFLLLHDYYVFLFINSLDEKKIL